MKDMKVGGRVRVACKHDPFDVETPPHSRARDDIIRRMERKESTSRDEEGYRGV
jgi:hypothetical protein